jgi:uncharacterized protein (TIGR03437 family)
MNRTKLLLCLLALGVTAGCWWLAAPRARPPRTAALASPHSRTPPQPRSDAVTAATVQPGPATVEAEPQRPSEPRRQARTGEKTSGRASGRGNGRIGGADAPPPALPAEVAQKLREEVGEKKDRERYDQPGEAAEFYRLKRVPPGEGRVPVEKYLVAQEHIRRMPRYSTALERALPPLSEARGESQGAEGVLQGAWEPLGPGNVGGRTRALLIHPQNPNVMYAAGVTGGVWKTTDGGASWTPLADLIANIAVNSLAFDPKNPEVIYAGTGEGVTEDFRGAGIFKTANGGGSWEQLASTNTADFHYVNDIVISPHDSRRMYAATLTGVWKSADGGGSWTRALGVNVTGGCLDLAARTDKPTDYVFATCGNVAQATIYRNTDAGGVGAWDTVHTESGMGRTSLALAPSNQDVVYAASASYFSGNYRHGLHAVFRSISSGDAGTWTAQVRNTDAVKLNTMLFTNPLVAFASECGLGPSGFASQGWYDNAIAVDPADANRVWVGGIDLFRSDDAGRTWGQASHWWAEGAPQYAHADSHVIVFHPQYDGFSNQRMFVGGDGGVFRTDNARAAVNTSPTAPCNPAGGTVTWTSLNNGYGVTQFYHGAVFPDGKSYIGGTQDNGTQFGSDAAGVDGWREVLGGDGGYVAVDPTNPNVIYAENTRLSLRKSTDGGRTFSRAQSGVSDLSQQFLFIAPFAVDPSDPRRLWLGGAALWRTTDGAALWKQASHRFGAATAIAVSPADASRVVAGNDGGRVFYTRAALTTDSNSFWDSSQPRAGYVSGVAFDPANADVVYATYSTFGGRHVWRSTDGGASWTPIDGAGATGIPDIPAHCVVIDPSNTARLYVGTDLGVFVSTDGGATWGVENTGFANVIVESMSLKVVNGATMLYAFTHGRGAWAVKVNDNGCAYSLGQAGREFDAAGGSGSVTVTASPGGCPLTAASNAGWITVTGLSGGAVNYTVAANAGVKPRAGTIAVGGKSFAVMQSASPDTTPPVIMVEGPWASGAYRTASDQAEIRGRVSDDLSTPRLSVTSDRGHSATFNTSGAWSLGGIRLASGPNRFTATALDAAGNTSRVSFTITYEPSSTSEFIATVAGEGIDSPTPGDGGPAINARFIFPSGICIDRQGNIYVADVADSRIRKITPDGMIATVAGGGTSAPGDNGPAMQARLDGPFDVAVDARGSVYIAESSSFRVRVVTPDGIIRPFAGTGERTEDDAPNSVIGDGVPALQAKFHSPRSLALDDAGNLYIADGHRVRRVDAVTGIIRTVAGTGRRVPNGNEGVATAIDLFAVSDIAVSGKGEVYISEDTRIRRVGTDGIIRNFAGGGSVPMADGVVAATAALSNWQLALSPTGELIFHPFCLLWKVDTQGVLRHLAGASCFPSPYSPDGTPAREALINPRCVTTDAAGTVYFFDGRRLRKLVRPGADRQVPTVTITSPTNSGSFNATAARMTLQGTAADDTAITRVAWSNDRGGSGTALGTGSWLAEQLPLQAGTNRITVAAYDIAGKAASATLAVTFTPPAALTTFAGNGMSAFGGEGAAVGAARLFKPETVTFDPAGNLYIADTGNHRVRRVGRDGVITTFAGSGQLGAGGDGGPATAAEMNEPHAVAIDAAGNVYIADTNNHRVRRVTPAGVISTLAGTGAGGFGGDGGPASAAWLNTPIGLAVDAANSLLIADAGNHRVRRVNLSSGVITTVAGGGYGFSGDDGQAVNARLNFPTSVAVDGAGNLYISDTSNNRVRKVTPDGVIRTAAGTGTRGYGGDGGAGTLAQLAAPGGIALDPAGNLFITDQGNHRVRKLTPGGSISTVAGTGAAGTAGDGGAATEAQLNSPAGVAVDRAGNLFIADTFNHRVVVVAAYNSATTASGATYRGGTVAAESIASAFGTNLATSLVAQTALPLPTSLGGTTVKVRDSLGVERLAPLFFVSALQVNYQIPPGTAAGLATVTVVNADGVISTGTIQVAAVEPGLFAANADGQGLAAALVLRVKPDGSRSYEDVFTRDAGTGRLVARPLEFGADDLYLELYGTGVRHRSAEANVGVKIGGTNAVDAPVLYAGAAPGYVGLDQVNIQLPRSLAGRGEVDLVLTVDGKSANAVSVTVR